MLAYSTVSQLGYMFLALGCAGADKSLASAAVTAAIFHVFTHAFFKALLFLSAGSVMHAMGDVIDMRRFSGLRKALPFTHVFFLSGAVALAGLPIFSGFWSKDAILDVVANASKVGTHKTLFGVLQFVGLATAFLTAFYTFRAYFMTFWGEERFPPEAGRHPHESPIVMAVPMAILTPLALFIGLVLGPGIAAPATSATPGVTILKPHQFAHYLQSNMPGVHHVEHHVNYGVLLASVALSVFGDVARVAVLSAKAGDAASNSPNRRSRFTKRRRIGSISTKSTTPRSSLRWNGSRSSCRSSIATGSTRSWTCSPRRRDSSAAASAACRTASFRATPSGCSSASHCFWC